MATRLADSLKKSTQIIRMQYYKLRNVMIGIFCLQIVYGVTLMQFFIYLTKQYHLEDQYILQILYLAFCFSYMIINRIIVKAFGQIDKEFKNNLFNASNISKQIVNKIDWTDFRKRNENDNTRIHLLSSVEEFYRLGNLKFMPMMNPHSYYGIVWKSIFSLNLFILTVLIAETGFILFYIIKSFITNYIE